MSEPTEKNETVKDLKKLLALAKQEGGKFGKLSSEEKFVVVNLKTVDKDGDFDITEDVMREALQKFLECAKNTGVMLVSVCQNEAKMLMNIPEPRNEICVKEWAESTEMSNSLIVSEKTYNFQTFCQTEKKKVDWSMNCSETYVVKPLLEGEFLKYRDEIIAKAFNFLNLKKLIPDEESDDEIYDMDNI